MNNDATGTAIVMQALMSRRSIRAFLPDAVDETTLRQIFDHARRAPSGSNTQPWKAYVLTGEARWRSTLAKHAGEARWRSTRCAFTEDPCRVQRSRG